MAPRSVIPLSVRYIRYTHDSISPHFQHGEHSGQPIDILVDDLRNGKVSVDASSLILDVVTDQGNFYSLRNRRLWCLKKYATEKGDEDMPVYVRVWNHDEELPEGGEVFRKYKRCRSTKNDGQA